MTETRGYQEFAISNFRTGFNESVEPWLLLRDGFQQFINCHLYRGVIQKIEGYELFAAFSYRNTIALTRDSATVYSGTLTSTPITTNFFGYGTIVVGSTAERFSFSSDDDVSIITLTGSAGGTGTIDLNTLIVTLTFFNAVPVAAGSTVFFSWDSAPVSPVAIMGIKQYFQANGVQDVMVFDQKRLGKIINIFGIIAATAETLQGISEVPHDYIQSAVFSGNGVLTNFTGTLTANFFVPGTVRFIEYTSAGVVVNSTIVDNGQGGWTGTNVAGGFINYETGQYDISFTVAPANGDVFNSLGGVYGNLFTGDIFNFFSTVNYQYKLFFTNNTDLIMYYDGLSAKFLNTNTSVTLPTAASGLPTSLSITKCLHVFVNRERLLLIYPTVAGVAQPMIQWSVAGDPLTFTNNEFLFAPTSERIIAIGYINTDLIVRFTNSERVFRYTADAFSPFRWDSTNNLWACDAPFSSINYDTYFTSVGRPAIVGSDGVNVQRVDEVIPDFTNPTVLAQQTPVPFINQTSIVQCYGERFDDIKEGWLCYNSSEVGLSATTASTNVLAFNYQDETYAIYDFPFSCLGFGRVDNVPTWSTKFTLWEDESDTWDAYNLQKNALVDLAGDQFDKVYEVNSGNSLGDGTTPILMSAITKNFNPFIENGELCRFGYIDLYVSAYNQSTLRVQFYVNDNLYIDSNNEPQGWYKEAVLTFTDTDSMSSRPQTKVWKRIYVGAVGKIHTIRFYQNEADFTAETLAQPIFIHSMVLYMKPAGRIFS